MAGEARLTAMFMTGIAVVWNLAGGSPDFSSDCVLGRLDTPMTLLVRAWRFAAASLREIVVRFSAVSLRFFLPGEVRLLIALGISIEVVASEYQVA